MRSWLLTAVWLAVAGLGSAVALELWRQRLLLRQLRQAARPPLGQPRPAAQWSRPRERRRD